MARQDATRGRDDSKVARRSVLAGAAGALGGLIAGSAALPVAVRGVETYVVLGGDNTSPEATRITGTTEGRSAIVGTGGPGAAGVHGVGLTMVDGDAGANDFTAGVRGDSSFAGVMGRSETGYGVVGHGGVGVTGEGTRAGVYANSDEGVGLGAITLTGTAITAASFGTGFAIRVTGRVSFSTSGLAKIAAGSRSVTVNPHTDVSGSSKVLATLQSSAGAGVAVSRITRLTSSNRIVIYLTAPARLGCTVAWFLMS